MTNESSADLGLDEVEQAADGRKSAAVDFIVIGDETELFFECGQDGHDGHGVEFRDAAEQGCIAGKGQGSAVKAEYVVEQGQQAFLSAQNIPQTDAAGVRR